MITASKFLVKPLSKAVAAALKLTYKQTENYDFKTQYYSGLKTFWPVQKNQTVIDSINELNSRNKVIFIPKFDLCIL